MSPPCGLRSRGVEQSSYLQIPHFFSDSFHLPETQIVTYSILHIFSRGSQFHVHPLLLFTYAEGGITCVLNIIAHVDSSLHIIHLRGGWYAAQAPQYPLASSFTSRLPSNLASFPANKKQLSHSHTSSTILSPSNYSPSPNSKATTGLLQHTNWKREKGEKERDREREFPVSLLSSPRLF